MTASHGTAPITLAGNILRIQPPLNIMPGWLARGFSNIRGALADFVAGKIPESVMQLRHDW